MGAEPFRKRSPTLRERLLAREDNCLHEDRLAALTLGRL
jgi:hypothetical protein